MIKHGNCAGCVVPPSVLEDAYKFLPALERIPSLEFVIFGGGTLDKRAGDTIATKSRLVDVVGSTEVGALPEVLPAKDEDWKIHRFHPQSGCRFRHHLDDLYEMVITRDDPLAPWNGLPSTFSEKGEYPMRDLYSHPPGTEDGWVYRGRIDDVIVLSNGEKINPVDMERHVSSCPEVKSAIVVGFGKFQPAILIELLDGSDLWQKPHLERLDTVWRYVEEANKCAPSHGRLMKEYVLFTTREKPFSRLPKGTVQRQMSTKQYEEEIDKLYESMESEDATELDMSVEWEDRKSMDESIYSLIVKTAPRKEIGREDLLFDYGFDSMHVVKFTRSLRNALRAIKSDAQQPELQRLVYANPTSSQLSDALWAMLHNTGGSENADSQNQQIHSAEISLGKLISALPRSESEAPFTVPRKARVVLTGSTGSLGSYILNTLLQNNAVESIICLNRASDALEKQKSSFSSRGLSTPLQEVKFLQANFSQPDFGLQTQDHDHLLHNATHIIHNAWQVDFNLPFTYYEASHLQGVLEIIKMSTKSRHKAKILFTSSISTISQWDTSTQGPVPETLIRDFSTAAPMGYALSKRVSELLLSEATQTSAIPVTICRIGQIAGPVRLAHGQWNASEWLPSLLSSSQELGKLPQTLGGMERTDWVPIDIVSEILVELLLKPQDRKSEKAAVHHIVNPHATTWSALRPAIQEILSPKCTSIPLTSWLSALQNHTSSTSNGIKLLPFYSELASTDPAKQTVLETRLTASHSPSLAALEPVSEAWMRLWIAQLGLGGGMRWTRWERSANKPGSRETRRNIRTRIRIRRRGKSRGGTVR